MQLDDKDTLLVGRRGSCHASLFGCSNVFSPALDTSKRIGVHDTLAGECRKLHANIGAQRLLNVVGSLLLAYFNERKEWFE